MERGLLQRLDHLESMSESSFERCFSQALRPSEIVGNSRDAGAPWEWIVKAYKNTSNQKLRDQIIRCAERAIDIILAKESQNVDPEETYHLGIILSRLQIVRLKDKLRRLVDRPCTFRLFYREIDVREQLLYHLESLGHLDVPFWKKEILTARFAGPAFLALARQGQQFALLYFIYLIEASIEINAIPVAAILQIVIERRNMEGFYERLLNFLSGQCPRSENLPPKLKKEANATTENRRWDQYREHAFKAFREQFGEPCYEAVKEPDQVVPSERPSETISIGIVMHEYFFTGGVYKQSIASISSQGER
ncbi:MAG: hypothetical protein JRD93_17965 [Deltaproteobacteria bacterium]|nr:hypothetical protein [Deltaproteobacteria bacterium]